MNDVFLQFGFVTIEYFDLILIIFLLATGFFLSRYISKHLDNSTRIKKPILYIIVWISFFLLSALLSIPIISETTIFENKMLTINILSLGVIIILVFSNTVLINVIQNWLNNLKNRNEKSNIGIFKLFIWLISAYISLKLVFNDFNKISDYVIFSIKDTHITVSNLIFFIIILLTTAFFIGLLKMGLKKIVTLKKIDENSSVALLNISKYFIWTFSIIFGLQSIGFNLSILLAGSAALLVGIGMGIQQLFNDFASGLILLFERQIKVGDYIETEEITGIIEEIGFRTTSMLTRDNVRIIIPNSKLVSNNVINWTNGEKYARFGLQIGVAYGSNVEKVKEILLECAKKHIHVLKEPKPEVIFKDFGSSSLDFILYVYSERNFYNEQIKSDLRFEIYSAFEKNNISIPFPQVDVHFPSKEKSEKFI